MCEKVSFTFFLKIMYRVDIVEMRRHSEFDIDSDGTVSEEEARVSNLHV